MRNVLLTLSIVLLPLLGYTQATFITQSGNSDSISANCAGNCTSFGVENSIKSAGSSSITLQWRLIDKSLGTNWKFGGFCDNNVCWGTDTVNSGATFTSLPYGSSFDVFHAVFDASSAANGSTSWVKMLVRDAAGGGLGYSRTLTFIARKSPTGVSTVTATSSENVSIYPVPASDAVNVVFDESLGIRTIAVYNLIGKLMGPVYKPAINGSAKINIADMPNGIYFLRLMDAGGRVVATRRFTHQ